MVVSTTFEYLIMVLIAMNTLLLMIKVNTLRFHPTQHTQRNVGNGRKVIDETDVSVCRGGKTAQSPIKI